MNLFAQCLPGNGNGFVCFLLHSKETFNQANNVEKNGGKPDDQGREASPFRRVKPGRERTVEEMKKKNKKKLVGVEGFEPPTYSV